MKWQQMRILNRRNFAKIPEGAVYVGRPSPFGNPFEIGKDGNRDEVIDKYREYFFDKIKKSLRFKKDVIKLLGRDLVCWCAPLACHAQVIIDWLRSREEGIAALKEQRERRRLERGTKMLVERSAAEILLHDYGFAVTLIGCGSLDGRKWWNGKACAMGSIAPRVFEVENSTTAEEAANNLLFQIKQEQIGIE